MKQPAPVKLRLPKKKPEPLAPFPEHGHVCLNCGHEVSNNFCSICGQSTATHRLSIKHFVLHDLVHSLWHIDRGVFFTLKEVLIRPGYAAIDYIRGKRAGRFPILTLLLLLIGLELWLYSLGKTARAQPAVRNETVREGVEWGNRVVSFMKHNAKWLLLGLIPLGSLSALIVFRRTRLNYTEQLLLNSYISAGLLVLLIVMRLIVLALPGARDIIGANIIYLSLLFYLFGYWQAYHKVYKPRSLVLRYGLFCMLNVFFFFLFAGLALCAALLIHPEFMDNNNLNLPVHDTLLHKV